MKSTRYVCAACKYYGKESDWKTLNVDVELIECPQCRTLRTKYKSIFDYEKEIQ